MEEVDGIPKEHPPHFTAQHVAYLMTSFTVVLGHLNSLNDLVSL